ncbi:MULTISPECIES: ABC transporter permease [unclassified Halomonas]|uniref:ABC transporter permease n=1 Tax=unclassified Halomonas TaxID=2609666 RepID=UPI0006DA8B21|nr:MULTISPECIES: ABC transporter permease [unclassified Halomonas]KPQ21442.1 MAG: ABC-type nickel uptake system permease component NikC [Halomonas sp. HL-93]SBR50132.1 peptide/nickel transport system permease protein [Halomonas sp. HL-93]SNY96694.1 peptide/nickel transport system permease protein [Halomonas sp. hl-4]
MSRAQPRRDVLWLGSVMVLMLVALLSSRWLLGDIPGQMQFDARLAPPSLNHWLGTDALGRELWARTLAGLSLSIGVGSLAALLGSVIALSLAVIATLNSKLDALVSLLIDTLLSVPHLILLLLIAFALGGGTHAVIIAVAVTHWPRLARLLRAELLQLRHAPYIAMSRALGKSRRFIVVYHCLPHVLPQCVVGALLLFPHAILHEAALTFLGVGLDPSQPAIGVLLADAMRYLSDGVWWLGVFPGLGLLLVVLGLERLSSHLRQAL